MSFKSLGLAPSLIKTLEANNYKNPYPIQEQAIPAILKKQDILGIAKTGSGKTASYALPLLMNLEGKPALKNRHINALVLVPTRELAMQVAEVFQFFGSSFTERIKTKPVYGGVSINPQMKSMMGVNILVATPGRLLELIDNKAVSLSSIETLVLDEADKMLNLGFKEEVDRIIGLLPKTRQNLLFSATLNEAVENINQILLHEPVIIKIEEKEDNIELINQIGYFISEEKKGPLLRHIVESKKYKQILVFTSSSYKADHVADKLRKHKIDAQAIHGKKSQGARKDAMTRFKNGNLNVLVATDLLARGIDIEFLPCVINYELPRSPKDYVHRIGRTGRAERSGDAISMVAEEEEHHFKIIQKKMKKWVTIVDLDEIGFR